MWYVHSVTKGQLEKANRRRLRTCMICSPGATSAFPAERFNTFRSFNCPSTSTLGMVHWVEIGVLRLEGACLPHVQIHPSPTRQRFLFSSQEQTPPWLSSSKNHTTSRTLSSDLEIPKPRNQPILVLFQPPTSNLHLRIRILSFDLD